MRHDLNVGFLLENAVYDRENNHKLLYYPIFGTHTLDVEYLSKSSLDMRCFELLNFFI